MVFRSLSLVISGGEAVRSHWQKVRVPSADKVPHVIGFHCLNITDIRQTSSQNNLWLLNYLTWIYVGLLVEFLICFVFIFPSDNLETYFLELRPNTGTMM
jgi:hypothetical protein